MVTSLDIFRALADPTRLRVFQLLRAMELAVGEIAQVIGQSQPRVSRHVRILVEAGLVDRRREGSWVFLTSGRGPAAAAITDWFDRVSLAEEERLWVEADLARLAAVRAERARAAAAYFAAHAHEWDAIRSLHVPEAEVEGAMRALLGEGSLGRFLDVGTGTGRMVELFGGAAESVIALDKSPDMLRLARAKLPAGEGGKYRLMLGDFSALPLEDGGIDTAIAHQVLHYAQAPDRVIGELGRVLGPGGRLVVVDFAPHDREELRSRDAHARLGFSDAQIAAWLAQAGLDLGESRELSGGALTVKIWQGRKRSANVRQIKAAAGVSA